MKGFKKSEADRLQALSFMHESDMEPIFAVTFSPPEGLDPKLAIALSDLRHSIGLSFRSLLELLSVLEDCELAWSMAGRYPWSKSRITQASHLRLTWFLFVNLTYLYKQKTKLFGNALNQACSAVGRTPACEVKKWVASAERNLAEFIRKRGADFHGWREPTPHIDFVAITEILSRVRPREWAERQADHYWDGKHFLRADIRRGAHAMHRHFLDLTQAHSGELRTLSQHFGMILLAAKDNPQSLRIVASKPNKS